MARLWLPTHYEPRTKREHIVRRLKELGVLVIGMESKNAYGRDLIETGYLLDILQKEEELARTDAEREDIQVYSDHELSEEEKVTALKEILEFRRYREAGTKKFF